MSGPRIGALCAGYAGLDLAVREVLGGELAWVAEKDPAAAKVLAHRFPAVPNLGDITEVDWSQVEPVDIVTAGWPCQDMSLAGLRRGLTAGTRSGLWFHIVKAIAVLRPSLVILENVRGLLSARADSDVEPCTWCLGDGSDEPALRALGCVLGDLADLGFDAEWVGLPASGVGACHPRFRVAVLAWPATHADSDLVRLESVTLTGRGGPAVAGLTGFERRPAATPTARDGKGPVRPTGRVRPDGRVRSTGDQSLADAVLLPTPRATDGTKGGPNQRGSSGDLMLPSAVQALPPTPTARDGKGANQRQDDSCLHGALLPTPTASDRFGAGQHGDGGADLRTTVTALLPTPTASDSDRTSDSYARGNPTLQGALLATPRVSASRTSRSAALRSDSKSSPSPEQNIEIANGDPAEGVHELGRAAPVLAWGPYEPAIRRWGLILGRPAPVPTEPGTKGQPRLSPRLVEWMQGLTDGWVTDVPGISRNDQLRILGNGVVPQWGAEALRVLIGRAFGDRRAA